MTPTLESRADELDVEEGASLIDRVRGHRAALIGVLVSLVFISLVWLASLPTGAGSPAGTVAAGSRLAVSAKLTGTEVLVVSTRGALSIQVAYAGPKGWLAAPLRAAPSNAVAAWAGTRGGGTIPAMSVVYGRAPGTAVAVTWADGRRTNVRTTSDGVYVAVRDQFVASAHVRVLDRVGQTLLELDGPGR